MTSNFLILLLVVLSCIIILNLHLGIPSSEVVLEKTGRDEEKIVGPHGDCYILEELPDTVESAVLTVSPISET